MHTALTIAGSDSSGGAGVQADLKTMLANGVFGESVITALTAQNTMGVDAVMNVPADFIEAQMKAVFTDIFPDAVKIGMTSSVDTIEAIAAGLVKYKAKNIVLDPVMVATSGSRLLEENAANTLMEKLFPLADIITPNIPELEVISGRQIESTDDIIEASKAVYDKYYENETFVRVLDKDVCPQTKCVEGSNYVDVNFKIDLRTGRVIMMGAIDNLVKGAAGQAVQNMNLIFGLPESEGLDLVPMFP